MDPIVDIERIVVPIENVTGEPKLVRMEVRRLRDRLYQMDENYFNFRHYGPEWEGQDAPDPPNWSELIRECENSLATKSKDLWVAVWLVEGLLLKYGFPGLAEGFEILNRLVSECWEAIEPNPSGEDGIEYTVTMLAGLDKDTKFIDRINAAPISEATGEHSPLTCGTLNSEDETVRGQLLSSTSFDEKVNLIEAAEKAHESFLQLCELMKEKCGDDAPPSFKVREALKKCEVTLKATYPEALPADESDAEMQDESGEAVGDGDARSGSGGGGGGPLQTREDAFRQLELVSAFFRKTEPHSPVSYALEKTVRLGRMQLPEMLSDLIDDESTREQIFRLIGIRMDEQDGDME